MYFDGHGAVLIVQILTDREERGIYVRLPIAPQKRTMHEKKPPWRYKLLGKGVYTYSRDRKA